MATSVLWVVKGLGPGGAEHLLAAAARAHDHDQFHLECAYVLPWKDHLVGQLEAAGVRTHCLSRTRSDPRWPLRLARLVRSGAWDVIHVHSPLPGSVARLAAATLPTSRRPGLVSTEHNRWATHRLPTRFANRLTGRLDDAALAVTEEVRTSMAGPITRHARTLRHGIDLDATRAQRSRRNEIRTELGIGPDELVIGTVANFRPQKDYPTLLRAAKVLADRKVPVRIVAVGQGPQEDEIRAMHRDLDLGDRVILTGFRDDAVAVMAACDAFTMASKWEGLPVAIMEALGLGLPIVATKVGGIAEEFHDGVDALLVPPRNPDKLANAWERIVTNGAVRERLAAASAARAPEFSVDRTVAELEDVYRRVARGRAATSGAGDAAITSGPADHQPNDQLDPHHRAELEHGAMPHAPARSAPSRAMQSTRAPQSTRTPRPDAAGSARPAPRSDPDLEIRPAELGDREQILTVLRRSLGGDDDPRYPELFSWKHDQNRFGPSPMWVAVDHGRVVAFRAFLRWEFVRGDRVVRAVRAVDTATDPDHQGKGLFTTLTRRALAEASQDGVDFVFNTPNDQSRPGYLKMGWREVGRLPAATRFTGPRATATALRSRVPADRWSQPLAVGVGVDEWLDGGGAGEAIGRMTPPVDVRELRTNIDEAYLRWRFATPLLGYRVVEDTVRGAATSIIVRSRKRGAALELAVVATFGDPTRADLLAARTAKEAGATYAIRLGAPNPRSGFLPLPGGGPMLTWRAVDDAGLPPRSNWNVTLGDIELF